MTALSLAPARAMAAAFPWDRHRSFVDIGCAEGGLPAQIALAHPHLAGGGFDLPAFAPAVRGARRRGAWPGRAAAPSTPATSSPTRCPRADVLVMGHVLHDWDLERKRAADRQGAMPALPPGGALIVYETLIDDDRRANAFGLLMSLNMLIETPGRLRLHRGGLHRLDARGRLPRGLGASPGRGGFDGGRGEVAAFGLSRRAGMR